jgi:Ca2+-binding EF-hand superfamily protein
MDNPHSKVDGEFGAPEWLAKASEELFTIFDLNKNGEIDRTEQKVAMKKIHSMTFPRWRWPWDDMDTDGDGKISESEFREALRAICERQFPGDMRGEKELLDAIVRTFPEHPLALAHTTITKGMWDAREVAMEAKESFNQKDIQALVTKIEKVSSSNQDRKDVITVCMCVVILQPISTPYSGTGEDMMVMVDDKGSYKAIKDWEGLKVMFDDKGLYKAIRDYPIPRADEVLQIQPIRELMKKVEDKGVREFSKAADGLLRWVQAVVKYHDLNKELKETIS